MDKLDLMFSMQDKLDSEIVTTRGLQDITPDQWIQKETLAMLSEMAELIAEVNFKWWKNPKEIDYNNVKDELVDVFHFFMSMCLKVGMDADELLKRYISKNEENFKRQQGLSEKEGYSLEEFLKAKK